MAKAKFSVDVVVAAIHSCKGIKSAIANTLGCSRVTVDNYIAKYPEVRQAFEEERERVIDVAELKLWEKLNQGELPAIFFVLKTIGKGRGYVERSELLMVNIDPALINKLGELAESRGISLTELINELIAELSKESDTAGKGE